MTLLSTFDVSDADLIGGGSEADVYALDDDRVLRVMKPGASVDAMTRRRELLDELKPKAEDISFRIPEVIDLVERDDELATVEARLPGEPLEQVLARDAGDRRDTVRAYLLASKEIARLTPEVDFYGDLMREENMRTHSFKEYAIARAHASLRVAGTDYDGISALEIADQLLEAPAALLHLDYCPANVLMENGSVSAVVDFSTAAIIGDRRIEPIAAALYLDPEITPSARDDDRELATVWLESNDLQSLHKPVQRWLAAYWAFAQNDERLNRWCRRILLEAA